MNFKATSKFTPGSLSRLEAIIVPRLIRATEGAVGAVLSEAVALVPRDTGELASSGQTAVTWQGQAVTGTVAFTAAHAGFVEFGTGIRGAESAGAGPVNYNPAWPGMPAQPYLRPAIDTARPVIIDLYRGEGFKVG